MSFDSNDPKWTALVLDELSAAETVRAQAELKASDEAQETVAGLRRLAALVPLALDNLPPIELSSEQRGRIQAARRISQARRTRWVAVFAAALGIVVIGSAVLVWRFNSADRPPAGASNPTIAGNSDANPEGQPQGLISRVRTWLLGPPPAETRLQIVAPATSDPVSLAISPDGTRIAFVAESEGRRQLWVRSIDSTEAQPLPGTEPAQFPFWSPDGRFIAFFSSGGKLKRVNVEGGQTQTIAGFPLPLGGAWNRDGSILFADATEGLMRVSANGGRPSPVPSLGGREQSQRFPQFLPDGRSFLYFASGDPQTRGVYAGRFEARPEGKRLIASADAPAVYASGHLLFVRQGTLFAQKFNPDRLELTGAPYTVAEQVSVNESLPLAAVSASANGAIAYRTVQSSQHQLVWFDRTGKEVGRVGPPSAGPSSLSISPDDHVVAMQRTVGENADIWLVDIQRDLLVRFTFDSAKDANPVWSPDGARIVFSSNRRNVSDLYVKSSNGAGPEQLLLETSVDSKSPADWSADGRVLLYTTGSDIWAMPLTGDSKPFTVLKTPFQAHGAQFSPDGKWIAYASNESGRFEIFVQPFPPGPGKWQISNSGGTQPRWRRDGKELFYIAPNSALMAAPYEITPDGRSIELGVPRMLFSTRMVSEAAPNGAHYVVSSDGLRFLIDTVVEEPAPPITIIRNWKPRS